MYTRLLPFLVTVFVITACQQNQSARHSTQLDYFQPLDSGMQTGGVRMIPVQTPKGNFKVWTKRFGNNPQLKVLLLNGGPGATHEYFECFENFLPAASYRPWAY